MTWGRYVTGGPGGEALEVPEIPKPSAESLHELLGHDVVGTLDGVELRLPEAEPWRNTYRALHGGVWALPVELAVWETFERGRSALATSHVHVSYLRRSVPRPITAVASRRHQGRLFGEVEVTGHDAEGRMCVIGHVTGRDTAQR